MTAEPLPRHFKPPPIVDEFRVAKGQVWGRLALNGEVMVTRTVEGICEATVRFVERDEHPCGAALGMFGTWYRLLEDCHAGS